MRSVYIVLGLTVLLVSCGKKSLESAKTDIKSGNTPGRASAESQGNLPSLIDNRPAESVLCEDGPKVIQAADKDDFSSLFAQICKDGTTTPFFKELIAGAYKGGEPTPKVYKMETGELYVTTLGLAHAIKVSLANPSMFADLKPHDIFAAGIKEANSELVINVEGRETFPGKRSVEKVVLNYDLRNANGAGIFDRRRTEFNTFLLVENNRDITVSTEHLLEPEKNQHYHTARGLTIGVKGEEGQSYFVFVTELVIKNRIEPERMKITITDLNRGVAKMLYRYINK